MCKRGDDEMIQMEYPKLPLDGLTPEEQIKALKRQVDILTDNLQIVLNSIEDDVGNVDNTSDKDEGHCRHRHHTIVYISCIIGSLRNNLET